MRHEVLHWLPQQDRWEPIDLDDWQAFATQSPSHFAGRARSYAA